MLEVSNSSGDSRQRQDHDLARITRETVAPDRKDGRPTGQPQGLGPEPYLNYTLLGEFVRSVTKEFLPKDGCLPARLRPGGDYAPEGRAYSSERRTVMSATAVMVS